ncbi:MAG: glucuronate isomerase [Sediminibacterium sp.]|nr:glucuronate isomerase [Sediminibacterium sp.]
MKPFLNENFLLENSTAETLFFDFAEKLPIIDYHCHLSPQMIAEDYQFKNLTEAWLAGDHYKWRAMRSNGINEYYCTGKAADYEKFERWAETVPYTLRNPLYHWSHLELQRYFNINDVLNPNTAFDIYSKANSFLNQPNYSVQNLIKKMNVQIICTTDDPTDSLEFHQQIKNSQIPLNIFPAFRPDKAMDISNVNNLIQFIKKLEITANVDIRNFNDYLSALKSRHDFFHEMGCRLSDHGLEQIYFEDYTQTEIEKIFVALLNKKPLNSKQERQFKSALLYQFSIWDYDKDWVQQFHLGALRNNNSRMMKTLGTDSGWDSIGDFSQASSLIKFLNKLDIENKLAKTILYNLNPADNEVFAALIGNFNDGSCAGKIQFGAAWWFLDQKDGIQKQLNALSNMGLVSRFVGMLTDSRSFLSFPRHEYFRRILCNLFALEIEKGELPNDIQWIGKIIQDICYYNAQTYFKWKI